MEDRKKIKEAIKRDIIKGLNSRKDNNIILIKKFVDKNGGKYILTPSNEVAYLVGASSTNEDYYYVVINKNLKVEFITCVAHIEVIDIKDLEPNDFYILDYIIKNNPEHLVDIVKNTLNETIDVLFSGIYINNVMYG